ncbi:alpha-mannosidase 2-like [Paramacrobiotus metropolitanus]|uniref:alpha-mannosidase 2-like n=1 Tax=Paramacrobiotus metropolitanus TaxID=2943436 RepID=UPI002445D3EC|nr:alpha-mannosidase 2-like [Paramacrobiotus metropolitanus]
MLSSAVDHLSMRRLRSRLLYEFRRIPTPLLIIGVIVVLSPFAVIHYATKAHQDSQSGVNYLPLNDPGSSGNGGRPRALISGVGDWLKESVWELSPVLRPPQIYAEGEARRVVCPAAERNRGRVDYDLANLTHTLTDLQTDGDFGIWDDKMEKNYQDKMKNDSLSKDQLLVYIVPFSHADPGWLNTVEEYFDTSIKHALNNMLQFLQEHKDMSFIWVETSYFKIWWQMLGDKDKAATRQLLKEGRLEIVNGGYVMPDEATCHYYAILHQYVFGHQWLWENLGVVPTHGFSIDPFGHSSSMPYFLKNLDFQTMFIQRIHYNLRAHLAQNGASEFVWEQPWDDTGNSSAMFTHLAPHHLYTIKNICGLTRSASCYMFDFKDSGFEIDKTQLKQQATALLDQMRKTGSIYPHNVVLYILGDDFRWAEKTEWINQYRNYKLLINEINGNPANKARVQFGTLKDYYAAVASRLDTTWTTPPSSVPRVQGDFFPYADKFEDYWTGYFTSRPFYKQMSRELERDLRTAEIMYSLVRLSTHSANRNTSLFAEDLIGLNRAAIGLGLFQHHDAITGTSKRYVAMDYGEKLQNGLLMAHAVILKNVFRLAQVASRTPVHAANIILENYRQSAVSLPVKSPIRFGATDKERRIFIFNSLSRSRKVTIHLFVETQNVQLTDSNGKTIPYQVSPALNDLDTSGDFFDIVRISFSLTLDPLALKAITIRSLGKRSEKVRIAERSGSVIRSTHPLKGKIPGFTIKSMGTDNLINVVTPHFSAHFSPETGLLEAVTLKDGRQRTVTQEFKRYETQSSGAYLFIPNGIADIHPYPRTVRVIEGPLFTEVQSIGSKNILHVTRIYNTTADHGRIMEMETITELTSLPNSEIVLRISSDVRSNMTFYTDSNGFQMIRRSVSHDVPMAANFYPATTMAYLQDDSVRLTLHLTQAHAVGSLKSGDMDVMIDRNLMQDDARGVGEALQDMRVVKTLMSLQIESEGFILNAPYSNPTDVSSKLNLHLNHPPYITFEQANSTISAFEYTPVDKPLPCDVHMLMMKPITYRMEDRRLGFMFHRLGMNCADNRTDEDICTAGKDGIVLDGLFKDVRFATYNETGLNFVQPKREVLASEPVRVETMRITAVTAEMPITKKSVARSDVG